MKTSFKILGIDPGTNIVGYSVLNVLSTGPELITMGVIKLQSYKTHQEKLKEIFLQIQEIIETYVPKYMAVEAPFYGKNAQSMLKLGRAQGVAIAAAITMGLDITEYSPKKIKLSITGNGNASKEQVAAMVYQLVDTNITSKYLDATDALATALTHFHQLKSPLKTKQKYKDWKSFLKDHPNKSK